jgi:hypothetical protein
MKTKKTTYVAPVDPGREPDYVSKRGVNYWWAPEWIRCTNSMNTTFGRIKPVKENKTVSLYMLSKDGNFSYIQGSIQKEFKDWHEQRKIDYFFLADELDDDALDEIILEGTS